MTYKSRENLEQYILAIFKRANKSEFRYMLAQQELRENLLSFLAKEDYMPLDLDSIILQCAYKVFGDNELMLNEMRRTGEELKEQMYNALIK